MKFLAPIASDLKSAPDLVARRIHDALMTGELRPGDRLPSEAELAENFGIALMTVRIALNALRDMGILHTRRGRGGGTCIALDVERKIQSTVQNTGMSKAELRDLTDWRRAISGEAAALAALRCTATDKAELFTSGAEFNASLPYFPALRFSDARFHILIAERARSATLLREETEIQAQLTRLILGIPRPSTALGLNAYTHDSILAAIEQADEAAARQAMIGHVESTYTWTSLLL